MTRPIARSANVTARTRRRQGTSALFRSALVMALVITCVLATPVVVPAVRSARAPGGLPASGDGGGLVAGHAAMSGLASGACMSFAPSGGKPGKTVFIDPGHGGLDPGVVGSAGGQQVLEKTVALSVGTRLAALLRRDGYRVVLSRTSDAATSSCVLNGFDAQRTTSAPPSRSVIARFAVSVVTCKQAEIRMPFSGSPHQRVLALAGFHGIHFRPMRE